MHRIALLTTGGTTEKGYVEQAGSMENTKPQIRRYPAEPLRKRSWPQGYLEREFF